MKFDQIGFPRTMRSAMALALLLAAACSPPSVADDPIADDPIAGSPFEPADLAAHIEAGTAPVILDARTDIEFEIMHIPGSINVPHRKTAERLPSLNLPVDKEIVVYCTRGGRASTAIKALLAAGYTNVHELKGHMRGWLQKGLPLTKKKK